MGGRSAVLAALALWTGLLLATVAGHSVTAGPSPHGIPLAAPLAIVAVSIACGWLALRLGAGTGALALVAAIGIGGLARGQAHALRLEVQRAPFIAHSMFRIEGSIVGPPALESGSAVAVIAVSAARPALARGCRVRIRLPDGCEAEWSDRVSAIAQLTPPEAERNPGGIDARAAAASASLVATGVARYAVTRPAEGLAAWPRALVMRWRRALERTLHSALTPATAELVAPLMFGDRTAVDSDLNAAFRAAGLTHLLALSGLHVAWLASLARALAAALGAGVRGRALARGACAALYVLLAGPIPSLARAAAGELLGAAARLAQRALDPVQALAVAALTLLAMFPGWAEDLGFQLSCAATLGLVTIGARLADTRAGTRARVVTFAFGATAGAQLASLPLLLGRFHALAWTSLLSNLVAVPVTGLLLASAWIGSLLEQGCPGAGMPFLHACEPVAFALRAIVNAASRVPGALLAGGHGNAPWLAGWAAALLAVGVTPARAVLDRMRPTPAWREAAAWTGASLSAAALALALFSRPLMPRSGHTWVVVLDVGQGDAIAIALGDGWWLVDAGGRTPRVDAGQSVVLPFLRWAGVRRLENLVLTHDDGDHIGGARAVLSGVRVERVLGPAPRAAVAGPLARFPGTALSRGDTLERDLPIVVLWPPPADSLREFWEHPLTSADNGAALVLELGRGPARALLAADADSAVERAIAVEPGLALLKVAHHGSGSSSGARFLGRVRPLYAAISVGRFNRFGHPDRGALARLEATGARVVRTDREGALWFDLSDAGISRIDWRAGTIAVAPAAGPASRMPAHHGFVSRNRSAIDPVHLPQR